METINNNPAVLTPTASPNPSLIPTRPPSSEKMLDDRYKNSRSHDLGAPHSRSYRIRTAASIVRRLEQRQLSGRDLNLKVCRYFEGVQFCYDTGLESHWSLDSGSRDWRVLPPWTSTDFKDLYELVGDYQ
jgi:hypothetical protein